MLYGKKAPKYILKYPDRVFVLSSLAEARKLMKVRKGGKLSKILSNKIID